jgi:CTD kinase subunit gamma
MEPKVMTDVLSMQRFALQNNLNMRINLLYFLDSLCEASVQALSNERSKASSSAAAANPGLFYVHLLERDLDQIVEWAVPESRDGLMNAQSTMQVCRLLSDPCVVPMLIFRMKMLENWRTKRIIDPKRVENAIALLQERKTRPVRVTHTKAMQLTSLYI